MQTVKIFRVYGAEGHRQRESFYRSYVSDISRPNSPRSIEVRNSDKTGTNDFSILQIVGESDIDCYIELQLQLSTGAFECSKVGDVYEILADGLAVKMGATDRGFLPVGTPKSLPAPTPSKLKKPHKREQKKYVSVLRDDGHIEKVLYDKIIEHENAIIDDNLGFGYLHNYTSQELRSYQKEAYADLKELKRQLREYPGSVIKEDPTTERFVLAYPNS